MNRNIISFRQNMLQPEVIFNTNASGSTTFIASNRTGQGTPRFELDGEMLGYTGTTFTRTLDGSAKVVRILTDETALQTIDFSAKDFKINNNLDFTRYVYLDTLKIVGNTGNLTSITTPSTLSNTISYQISSSKLTTLDLSRTTKLGADIRVYNNTLLNSLTYPSTPTGDNITYFYCHTNPLLTGTLNISQFTKLGGDIQIRSNAAMSGITFPATIDAGANAVTNIAIRTNDVIRNVDISMFQKYNAATIDIGNSALLTGITFPSVSTGSVASIQVYSNPKITSIDLRAYNNTYGSFYCYSNTLLETILMASANTSTSNYTGLYVYLNPKITSLNLSTLTKLGGDIQIYSNTLLSAITMPVADAANTQIRIYSNPALLSLDLSGMAKVGSYLGIYGNTLMSALTFATTTSTSNITNVNIYSNPALITLNISVFTRLGGNIQIYSNTNLTTLTLPSAASLIGNDFTHFNIGSCTSLNQTFELGIGKMIPATLALNNMTSMSRTNFYTTIKNIYDNRTTYSTSTNKTINVASNGFGPLVAPTGYVLNSSDGTIITPINDTERIQAVNEMLYVLHNQTSGGTSKYKWTVSI